MSAVTAYTDFIWDVLLGMDPAPSEKLVERMLRQAGRQFCKDSGAWYEDLDVINLTAYQTDYTMAHDYSTNALIERVVTARVDGRDLTPSYFEVIPTATFRFTELGKPVTDTDIDAYSAASTYETGDKAQYNGVNYRCRADIDTPESFTATNWERIEDGLYLRVVFRPTYEATYLPAAFFDKYAETIVAGARYLLLSQAGRPWANPMAARQEFAIFQNGIGEAKSEIFNDHIAGDPIAIIPRV